VVALCASVGGSPVEVAAAVLAASQADPKVAAALAKSAPAIGAAVQVSNDVNVLTEAAKKAAASVPAN
jgi:geranylgeranyl pyrophosphate synthase